MDRGDRLAEARTGATAVQEISAPPEVPEEALAKMRVLIAAA